MQRCLRPLCHTTSRGVRTSNQRSISKTTRPHIADLVAQPENVGRDVEVNGWIRSVRKQKQIAFAAVGDGSTLEPLQAVLTPEQAVGLSHGAAVRLIGSWQASSGRGQQHELRVSQVQVLGENDATTNPVQPKRQTAEFLRTIPHLRARTPANALLLRLRSHLIASVTTWFHAEGFVQTHTPVITSSDCEGAGEVFTVSAHDGGGSAAANAAQGPPMPSGENAEASAISEKSSQQSAEQQYFFRSPKYLTVSAQLHLEALAHAATKVWTLSPTFRAERSDTPRHLSEFYMLEAEICFVDDVNEIMDLVERMLRALAQDLNSSPLAAELLKMRSDAVKENVTLPTASPFKTCSTTALTAEGLQRRWTGMAAPAWPRITYASAISKLLLACTDGEAKFANPPSYQAGLQAEHERFLAEKVGQGKPVFVTHYPRRLKPFYVPVSASRSVDDDDRQAEVGTGVKASAPPPNDEIHDEEETVACFDLLVPDICELAGGSLREHRSTELKAAMLAKTLISSNTVLYESSNITDWSVTKELHSLDWYMDLRRFGSVPHGGFGLGFDRLVAYLGGVGSVRDVVAFPRWVGRCAC